MTDSNVINLNDYRTEELLFHVGIIENTRTDGSREFDVVLYRDVDGDKQALRIPEDCILPTITALCDAGVAIATAKGIYE